MDPDMFKPLFCDAAFAVTSLSTTVLPDNEEIVVSNIPLTSAAPATTHAPPVATANTYFLNGFAHLYYKPPQ
jgi:hypothetical protein